MQTGITKKGHIYEMITRTEKGNLCFTTKVVKHWCILSSAKLKNQYRVYDVLYNDCKESARERERRRKREIKEIRNNKVPKCSLCD